MNATFYDRRCKDNDAAQRSRCKSVSRFSNGITRYIMSFVSVFVTRFRGDSIFEFLISRCDATNVIGRRNFQLVIIKIRRLFIGLITRSNDTSGRMYNHILRARSLRFKLFHFIPPPYLLIKLLASHRCFLQEKRKQLLFKQPEDTFISEIVLS